LILNRTPHPHPLPQEERGQNQSRTSGPRIVVKNSDFIPKRKLSCLNCIFLGWNFPC
jgi:hypothetical protein